MKILLIVLGAIVIIIAAFVLLLHWASKQPAVKQNYYENTVSDMPLEQKYTSTRAYEVS
ncbi:MAG: hypothetical protein ACI4J1_08585 [Ruminiclostridium sp.]